MLDAVTRHVASNTVNVAQLKIRFSYFGWSYPVALNTEKLFFNVHSIGGSTFCPILQQCTVFLDTTYDDVALSYIHVSCLSLLKSVMD